MENLENISLKNVAEMLRLLRRAVGVPPEWHQTPWLLDVEQFLCRIDNQTCPDGMHPRGREACVTR